MLPRSRASPFDSHISVSIIFVAVSIIATKIFVSKMQMIVCSSTRITMGLGLGV